MQDPYKIPWFHLRYSDFSIFLFSTESCFLYCHILLNEIVSFEDISAGGKLINKYMYHMKNIVFRKPNMN